jgi:hypothetical protein
LLNPSSASLLFAEPLEALDCGMVSFPVWSGGTHGPTAELVERLRPMLAKYGAHYMCGHDHVSSFHDEGLGPVYIVAGNGANSHGRHCHFGRK